MVHKVRDSKLPKDGRVLTELAAAVADRFGFRPVVGRVWAVLYLAVEPLDAEKLRKTVEISSGAMSMALGELMEYGFIYRETAAGERRYYYRAEKDLWVVLRKIAKDRIRPQLAAVLDDLKHAESRVSQNEKLDGEGEGEDVPLERLHHLVNVVGFVTSMLDVITERTRVELKAAQKWLNVSEKFGGEPLSKIRKAINTSLWDRKNR